MPINNYGVWVADAVRVSAERSDEDPTSPHIHLFYDDGSGGNFEGARRASINAKSGSELSELVFWLVHDFQHPIVDEIRGLARGFHRVPSRAGGQALDYIRGNLMELRAGRVLPHDLPGERDDIIDFVMPELQAAIDLNSTVYLFGEPYSDQQGIHDVHMNQGSQGGFSQYNGVWQDGGIIIHFPGEDRFAAIFLAFASQAAHTGEADGHGLPGSQNLAQLIAGGDGGGGADGDGDGGGGGGGGDDGGDDDGTIVDDQRVVIVAALVNPVGGENQPDSPGRPEMVIVLNRSRKGLSLSGWSLLNKNDEAHVISADIWLAPGEARSVTMAGAPLANRGGLISLLDANGNKVDGVSYTREQARHEGEFVVFR